MKYCINKIIEGNFDIILHKIKVSLNRVDFEVIFEIDMQKKIKEKLGQDFRRHIILGVSNIEFVHNVLQKKGEIIASLPCNIIVRQINTNEVEVIAIHPLDSMKDSKNELLDLFEYVIKLRLAKVIESISIPHSSEFYF